MKSFSLFDTPPRKTLDRPKAYSYIRFSTPEQSLGHSFIRQIEGARDFAKKHDLDLDESFKDEGISAFRGAHRDERAALGAFLKAVEVGRVAAGSYLIVESLDRLSREEVVDALELFLGLTRNGIIIVTLADGHIYSRETLRAGPTLLIISIIELTRSHGESARKSEMVGKAWAHKRELAQTSKQAMTARCPGWIQLVGGPKRGHYELIEDRVAIVRSIFAQTISGLGKRAIQKRLNQAKIPTWGPGKKKPNFWHESYIGKILSNPATYGEFTPKGDLAGGSEAEASETIQGYFPAVIDRDTFEAAQASIKSRSFGKGKPGARHNLLRGLVRCAACGSGMVYLNKESLGYEPGLKCGRAHGGADCLNRSTYSYRSIELAAVWGVGKSRGRGVLAAAEDHKSNTMAALDSARTQSEQVTGILSRLFQIVETNEKFSPELAARIQVKEDELAGIKARIKALEAELERARPQDVEEAESTVLRWSRVRREARGEEEALASLRRKLGLIVDHINVGPGGAMTSIYRDGSRTTSSGISRPRRIGPARPRSRQHRSNPDEGGAAGDTAVHLPASGTSAPSSL